MTIELTDEPVGGRMSDPLNLYRYADDPDPLLIVDPPDNIEELLIEWVRLDDERDAEPLSVWLAARDVVTCEPWSLCLDNYHGL